MDELTEILWYLVGDIPECSNHNSIYSKDKKKNLPPIVSPINRYIQEVNRFLFDGGLNIDVSNDNEEKLKTQYLEDVVNRNELQSNLYSIWETGVIEGEILVTVRLSGELYKFDFFSKREFNYYYDNQGNLDEVNIEKLIYDENEDTYYVFKFDLNKKEFINYPLVEYKVAEQFDWNKNKTVVPHEYRFVPAKVIKNRVKISEDRGISDFNHAILKQAVSEIMAVYDALENVHLFGNPFIISPDPDDTLDKLKKRIQVLTSMPEADAGKLDTLNFNAISKEHLDFIDQLKDNFNDSMGIKSNNSDIGKDVSSLTLRIQNSATISKAESKWKNYVDNGLKPLLEKVLLMANTDGILSNVDPLDTETYNVNLTRSKPYFPTSPSEKVQQLNVATQLVELGVDRAEALKETIWSDLTLDEIESKLSGNLDDMSSNTLG
jgi:hypothetical protein